MIFKVVNLAFLICGVAWAAPALIQRAVTFHENKKIASERFFQEGRKVGVHKTWFPNGKLQSLVEFEKPNQAKILKTWYENGQLAKLITFKDGMEADTKIYRETGQIYLNRVVRNGRMYGLPGGKACSRIKTEVAP